MLLNVFDLFDHIRDSDDSIFYRRYLYNNKKIYKRVKISDKKEQRFGDIVTPFSRSNAKRCQKLQENLLKIKIFHNYIIMQCYTNCFA